jgi:hypothetical protein
VSKSDEVDSANKSPLSSMHALEVLITGQETPAELEVNQQLQQLRSMFSSTPIPLPLPHERCHIYHGMIVSEDLLPHPDFHIRPDDWLVCGYAKSGKEQLLIMG